VSLDLIHRGGLTGWMAVGPPASIQRRLAPAFHHCEPKLMLRLFLHGYRCRAPDGNCDCLLTIGEFLHHYFAGGDDSASFSGLGSSMTMFFPFIVSACSNRIRTAGFSKSSLLTENRHQSICISLRHNRPSLMADCTYRQKTLQ
jgi:hypothetical protein